MNPSLGVLIRFSNSADTLPAVLEALKQQTLQPDSILGVDSGSMDGSSSLIEAAGGRVVCWSDRYEHSKVLNFGVRQLPTDLVLVLSSHTVLESPGTLASMVEAMSDPCTACVSGRWDDDPCYSDAIDWNELRAKGLKFGSIYSNSMGMFRRSLWEQMPFDEAAPTAEDYAWAVAQVRRGHLCKRLRFPFSYRRNGHTRDGEFAHVTFRLARKHGLKVAWLGPVASIQLCARGLVGSKDITSLSDLRAARQRLAAWIRESFFRASPSR